MGKKIIKCKVCGADIAKSAKACPHCGAKRKSHNALGILGIILILFLVLVIAYSGNEEGPQKNDQESLPSESASLPPSKESEVFTLGDKVSLGDIYVTLVDVSENKGGNYMTPSEGKVFVVCEFEIENNSDKDIGVSSMLSFEAYIDDYSTPMNLSAMLSTDKQQLDGSVAAGKKMNGVIGYEADPGWSEIEVRFKPNFLSGKKAVFVASK